MSHIFMEESSGSSEHSLADAINNAIGMALQSRKSDGDHMRSLTVVVDGYEFDGKKYRVKLRVIILDHELAYEDHNREIEKMREHEKEPSHISGVYLAAAHASHSYHSRHDHFAERLKEVLEHTEHRHGIDEVRVVAPSEVHDHIERELGYAYTPQGPKYPKPHTDLAEPTLGPGSAGSSLDDTKGKAA